jgi:hypothetical protein
VFTRTLKWLIIISLLVRIAIFLWEYFYPLGFNSTLQNFSDFYGYYLQQLALLSHGFLPYRDFPYAYPPLFLYVLYPFYLLGPKIASIPIILSDALTAPLIYMIARRGASENSAIASALVYVLSPFFFVYVGMAWLSEQPMLFFLILSVYLLQSEKRYSSALAFGVAILFKQDALLAFPAYFFWMIRKSGLWQGLRALSLTALTILGVSLPFLLLTPVGYISSVSLGRFFAGFKYLMPLPNPNSNGVSIIGGISFTSSNLALPILSCSNLVYNIFELSRVCVGGVSGQTITNWVSIGPTSAASVLFILISLALLVPLLPELFVVPKRARFPFSFAVSFMALLVPLFLFHQIETYKYYLVPTYALLIASSTDWVSLVIATSFPVVALFTPYDFFTLLTPLLEMQFLAAYWIVRFRSSAVEANEVTRAV